MRFPICNNRPDRAPHIFGHPFILCWRCSMVAFGATLTQIVIETGEIRISLMAACISICLLIPMISDGFLQYYGSVESTNLRRALTGLLFGSGAAIISTFLCEQLF